MPKEPIKLSWIEMLKGLIWANKEGAKDELVSTNRIELEHPYLDLKVDKNTVLFKEKLLIS